MSRIDPHDMFEELRSGSREALAKAITLIESELESDRPQAHELLRLCLPFRNKSAIIGITGVPGVGKSTLIDELGMRTIEAGHRLAVLAIDPSSKRSKGSILGDKTRMEQLAQQDRAFIRPSPTSGLLGGISRRTREASILCAAAGYDRIFVETVGVGQNELLIDEIADITLLLLLAGAGDELQGIKRGIMESADVMAINKADGSNLAKSKDAAQRLRNAMALMPVRDSGKKADVLLCSALENEGINELHEHLERLHHEVESSGSLSKRRAQQQVDWMHQLVSDALLARWQRNREVREFVSDEERKMLDGQSDPFSSARAVLEFMGIDPETPS